MEKQNPTKQHFVPVCYQNQFIAPDSPSKKPYVWVISKDGKQKRKHSPSSLFAVNDLYTVNVKGKKDYSIEKTLGEFEGEYASVFKNKIQYRKPLSENEHLSLCIFVCLMLQRTLRHKESIETFIDQLIELTERTEKNNGLSSDKSNELKDYKKDAHKSHLLLNLPDLTTILFKMNLAFLFPSNNKSFFISSDDPCNMFNPTLQWQKFYGPGLAQKDIELTIPLSPKILACFSWSNVRGYIEIPTSQVEDTNRMIRAKCHKEFISPFASTKLIWFSKVPINLTFVFKFIKHKIIDTWLTIKFKYDRKNRI